MFMVLTAVTSTRKIRSTASRIWPLVARGSTSKTYLFCSLRSVDRSVIRGRCRTVMFMSVRGRGLGVALALQSFRQHVQRRLRQEELVGKQDAVAVQVLGQAEL